MKRTIEAALFISGRWLTLEDLGRICSTGSLGSVREAVEGLKQEYQERGGGTVILDEGGKYRMEVTPDIKEKVYYLAPEPELSPALIKTLALVAYKQPISQSKVVEVIGNRAYEYIKELRKKEFITIRKKGRTKLISTTGRFRKYFALEGAELPWQMEPDEGAGGEEPMDDAPESEDLEEEPEGIAEGKDV
jgi:segregation and condensation protein B